jgi:2-C-methyl-D-erythritol 4-phosphate cytidylyltransferase
MSTCVIIPAAGTGSRMKLSTSKQFFVLEGMPVLLHLLKRVDIIKDVGEVILALREGDVQDFSDGILKGSGLKKKIKTVIGGETRQESVKAALDAADDECDLIMVHDAVRPLVTPDLIENAIEKTRELNATVTAVKVKDTIKEVKGGIVTKTLDRDKLYAVQTPQTFKRDIIIKAHENALKKGIVKTDDAALVEETGQKVHIVRGSYDNIKITTDDDLTIAKSILQIQRKTLNYF